MECNELLFAAMDGKWQCLISRLNINRSEQNNDFITSFFVEEAIEYRYKYWYRILAFVKHTAYIMREICASSSSIVITQEGAEAEHRPPHATRFAATAGSNQQFERKVMGHGTGHATCSMQHAHNSSASFTRVFYNS